MKLKTISFKYISSKLSLIWEWNYKIQILNSYSHGVIPYRVVHNDPKLNNVLFDKATAEPICMIDLDTIMPGTSLFDVGDALRSIANTASEDDKTTDNVSFSTEIFEKFVKRFTQFINKSIGIIFSFVYDKMQPVLQVQRN